MFPVPPSRLMDADRWERVKELFEAALERAEAERSPFLAQACLNDEELRLEVESLLSGEKNAGDFMQTPVVHLPAAPSTSENPPSTFSPGQTISGRFKVLRFIGHGGMGEVYEAKDLDLGERVALKTIRPEIASQPRTMARFKQEIQLARRVTHPNVCRMFDLERHRPSPETDPSAGVVTYLTMELLEGETLAARLRRAGPMTTAAALPLVEQMAAALGAAHDVGVVHRDFKPGNVMLVPSNSGDGKERAVVTDFGLAKAVATDQTAGDDPASSVTASGHIIGTLAYMSPEQLQGREATPASDIYALGLVMYEMVTGERPFAEGALLGGACQRSAQPPASPRVRVPGLDPPWESAIRRCLEVDPAKRSSDTRSVIAALKREAQPFPRTPPPPTPLVAGSDWWSFLPAWTRAVPRKKLLAEASLAIVIFLALLVWYLRLPGWSVKPQVAAGATVLLTDIANATGDPELDGVTEVLRNSLAQSAHFNLMDKSRMCEVLQRMTRPCAAKLDPATAREVAMRDDVPRVVFGTLSKVSEDYVLNLDIEKPDTEPAHRRQHWTQTFSASSKNELFDRIRDGSDWIRKTVGEAQKEIDANDRPPQDVTTDSWEALNLFWEAGHQNASGKPEDAITLLKLAIEKDPSFTLAYMTLGDMYDSLGNYRQGYESWKRSLDAIGARRLTPREELRIRGLYALDTADFTTAVDKFRAYALQYPYDYLGDFYQAYPLMMLGRTEEAIEALRRAERKRPDSFYPPYNLGRFNLILLRFKEVEREVSKLRELGHQSDADYLEGETAFLRGDPDRALRVFAGLRNAQDPYNRSESYYLQASVLAEQGLYRQALQVLDQGIGSDRVSGRDAARARKLLAVAYLRYRQGDRTDCRLACLGAIEADSSLQTGLRAGTLLARAGYLAEANKTLENLDPGKYIPISEIVRHRLKGEILLQGHDCRPALKEFREAFRLQAPAEDQEYLAHALEGCSLFVDALNQYKSIFERPGQIWQKAEDYLPGSWTDNEFQYARIGFKLGSPEARGVLTQYLIAREHADADLPDRIEAQGLLNAGAKSR